MKEIMNSGNVVTSMLFPLDPELFLQYIRQIIREEINNAEKQKPNSPSFETPGMTHKPLYKISDVCALFHVTKPTIYDWVKHGELKPFKIRSRVFFLWQDIQQLISPEEKQ